MIDDLQLNHSAEERRALDRLAQAIDQRTVIPVIGAGVSNHSANMPLWRTLLAEALAWTEDNLTALGMSRSDYGAMRNKLDLSSPTTSCYQTWVSTAFKVDTGEDPWTNPLYQDWLVHQFDRPVDDQTIYGSVKAINPRIVITTNYDELLTQTIFPNDERVTWENREAMRRLLREGTGVLHLHGVYSDAGSVILTESDYARIVATDIESSAVAQMLTSHSILLFIGVSPSAACDRHLGKLMRLDTSPKVDGPQKDPAHILLHPGTLPPEDRRRLGQANIQHVSFGEKEDLGRFLAELLQDATERQNAMSMLNLKGARGVSLFRSQWEPKACCERVERDLRFMGWRSSKWVEDHRDDLESLLEGLRQSDSPTSVRFLIVQPGTEAFDRVQARRPRRADTSHIEPLTDLAKEFECFSVKCVDYVPEFRITAIDDRELGLALYPTSVTQGSQKEDAGWSTPHYSLSLERPGTLGKSLVSMFDQMFEQAKPLD